MRVAMAATIRPRPDRPSVGGRALDDALINKLTWKIPNASALFGSASRRRRQQHDHQLDHAGVDASVENVEFLHGMIEEILLPDQSVDVMNSNCVLNLGPDKTPVFAEMARVLRPHSADGPSAPKVAHRRIEDTDIDTSRSPPDWPGTGILLIVVSA